MSSSKPSFIGSVLKMRCPNCRKGHMYTNKSIFPLGKLLDMPEECPVCGQEFELEVGFYYGTGYVSYALSVGLLFLSIALYWIIFGLSYDDNSVYYALAASVGLVILLQPWLMRISRVLYLNIFVKYGRGTTMRSEE